MKFRSFRQLTFLIVALGLVVSLACAPAPPPTPTPVSKPAAPAPAAPPKPAATAPVPAPAAASTVAAKPAALATTQEKLDELSEKSRQERQRFLEEQATKEGKVVMYSSADPDLIKDWNTLFKQKYPSINAEFVRMTGTDLEQKVMTESQTGRPAADILASSESLVSILQGRGVLASYTSPESQSFDQGHRDARGFHTTVYYQPTVVGVNTKLAKKTDAPTTLEGLANPALKGKLGRPALGGLWVAMVFEVKGEAAGMDLLKKIATVEPRVYDSATAAGNALASGQIAVAFDIYVNNVAKLMNDGAPVDYVVPQEVFVSSQYVAVSKDAPHPYAAALAYDWLLTKEGGQSIYVKHGRLGPRKDTEYAFANIIKEAKMVVGYPASMLANSAKYQKIFEDLFIRR